MAGLILSFVKFFAQLRIHIVHESYLGSVPSSFAKHVFPSLRIAVSSYSF